MYRGIFAFLLCFVPPVASGQIVFTEIMYDLEGSDADREWVEIFNSGSAPADLTGWKFSDGSNHILNAPPKNGGTGSLTIPAGAYAVLTENANVFLSEHSGYSGAVIDTAMGLNNTGATLSLINKDGSVAESVSYDKSPGGAGDGNSLQKNSSGAWIAVAPTPGAGGAESPEPPADSGDSIPPPEVPAAQTENSNWPVEPQVFAVAGKDRIVITGAAAVFEGRAYGLKKEPLENARFVWNFGDGMTGEGKTVLHTYRHPGEYLVVLDTSSGFFSGSDRMKVRAEASPLFVSAITDGAEYFIEITNTSKSDIDISSWWLALTDKKFEIPRNTFVLAGKKLIFSNEATGLTVGAGSIPELLYPNGALSHRYGEAKKIALAETAATNTTEPQPAVYRESGETPSEKDEIAQNSTAAAANSRPNSGFNYTWLLGVAGISAVSVAGIFLARRYEQPEDEAEKLAREIEIVED